MSKIMEAIEALATNATHPKFITAALKEIKTEFDDLKARLEKLESPAAVEAAPAPAAVEPAAPAPAAPVAPVAPAVPPVTA
jgi:hypothetical protein